MLNWNTDKIIGAGLIIALFLKIVGDIAVALINGTAPPSDLPMKSSPVSQVIWGAVCLKRINPTITIRHNLI